MWVFGHWRNSTPPGNGLTYGQIEDKLDSALTRVFTEDGKKTVLYYMTEKYSLTLEQASADPRKLEEALTNLLGEVGWSVVKRNILEQFKGYRVAEGLTGAERASLSDAFGMIRSLGITWALAYRS